MELLAPAGNLEKLKYAYQYGADAAYIGISQFSLRAKADNFHENEWEIIKEIKGNKKLYCALNIYFHNPDIRRLEEQLDYFEKYPFDAFIVSDIGIVPMLKRKFPNTELHLSTQANCTNAEAASMYKNMGFDRVVLGREVRLDEIKEIKDKVPDLELEAFVHGAMCLAYSGRCFLSSWMTDRSANQGGCSHSCRWDYKVLEEKKRPGEYYPIYEGDGFTSILSSKDINMIHHLMDLKMAGVDSAKIEGRMKSIYYVATVARAYRKALDVLEGKDVPDFESYAEELDKVSHREFSTGFYFGKEDIEKPNKEGYERYYTFLGIVGKKISEGQYELNLKNQVLPPEELEFIGPDVLFLKDRDYTIYDVNNQVVDQADHGKQYIIETKLPLEEGYLIRRGITDKELKFKQTSR
ncbi:peptidase U32 family protein [Spirochaeta cellobiosiphila]|uniref:peptidase U32 family protein n=1 Tax=Spirochaeta cellobiosiphila TaxID=504483 RepID=UPI00040A949A|nr:U32 family peptidase [Spirochaeta cellobiosiphila]